VLHAKALQGNPFDGHTLGPVVADLERLTGIETRRIHVDKGYRGHNHPHDGAEDKRHGTKRGDEMPDWVADKQKRLEKIRAAKAALEAGGSGNFCCTASRKWAPNGS